MAAKAEFAADSANNDDDRDTKNKAALEAKNGDLAKAGEAEAQKEAVPAEARTNAAVAGKKAEEEESGAKSEVASAAKLAVSAKTEIAAGKKAMAKAKADKDAGAEVQAEAGSVARPSPTPRTRRARYRGVLRA